MKNIGYLIIFLAMGIIACSGNNPISEIEATNQEAIYNVLFFDNSRLIALNFLPTVIPDTFSFLNNPDSTRPLVWHEVQYTIENLDIIVLDQPVASPVGPVYQGNISYTVIDTGLFRMIRYNAAADSLERYSTRINTRATRSAVCQQWGRSNQTRRGWILTLVSDARYITPGRDYHFLSGLGFSSTSHRDTSFSYGMHDPSALMSFSPNEEVTFRYQLPDSLDHAIIFTPFNDYGYHYMIPQADSLGNYEFTFSMPSRKIYGQLFFMVVYVGQFDQPYRCSGYSYSYRVR